jgi:uncharacterized protein YjbI with pentapeptide repeats
LFNASFQECQLSFSSFFKCKLNQFKFSKCNLQEVDFTEADLKKAALKDCDLSGAIFDRTILEAADLSTAYNYTINPEINQIRKATFSSAGLLGLLRQYDIEIV